MKEKEEWHSLDDWVVALLFRLGDELDRVMWNINQKIYDNPFGNAGDTFKCSTFIIIPYDWDLDLKGKDQPYNFKYKDIKIRWYKHLKRCPEVNGKYTNERYIAMFNNCFRAILDLERKMMRYEQENE